MPDESTSTRVRLREAGRWVWFPGFALAALLLAAPDTAADTIEKRVVASSDDAEESSRGRVTLPDDDLELTFDKTNQVVGLRWTGLAIPSGVTITAAYIQFAAKESHTEATSLSIRAHAVDSAPTFGSNMDDLSIRPRTTASVAWSPAAWTAGQAGTNQRTGDLSTVLQEIVSRPGWASGNALVLLVTGTGHRTAWAFDGNPSVAPLLHVEYAPPDDPPVARLSVTQAPSPPLTALADASASTDTDATPIASYRFDFGDGTPAVTTLAPTATAQHEYSAAGTYTVTLTVTDTGGLTSAPSSASVTVTPPDSSVLADEIHWTFMGQTAVTFDWRGGSDTLRYGPSASYGQIAIGLTPSPLPFSSAGPFREARLTGLAENTTYHYAIGGDADRTFRTPPPRGTSDFTIVAQGDIGAAKDYSRVAPIQSRIASLAPDFVLMLGDLTYANDIGQPSVDAHFNDMMVWSREAAYMPVWGNHEWDSAGDDLRNYKGRFDLPNPQSSVGAPEAGCCGEDWSWFDYGNVRFISYPENYIGAFADWATQAAPIMDAAEADPAIAFIVTFGHRPAWSSGNHPGMTSLQNLLAGLAADHPKYVLNLNGHSHNYERSHPQSGVVHVTAGTGGSGLHAEGTPCGWTDCPPPAWSAFRAMHHVVLQLRFTAGAIEGTTYCGPAQADRNDVECTEGTILDTFTIPNPAAPPEGPNLVGNPSFETGTAGWNGYNSATLLRVGGGHDGAYACQLTATVAGSFGINDSPHWVDPTPGVGTRYRFKAKVRSASSAGQAKLRVTEYLGGTRVGSTMFSTPVTLSPFWQELTMDFVTGAAGSQLDFQVVAIPVTAGEVFVVDDISISDVTGNTGSVAVEEPETLEPAPRAWVRPSPMASSGTLGFTSTREGAVKVEVFDLLGRRLATLLDQPRLGPGRHEVSLRQAAGREGRLEAGIYLYRVWLTEAVLKGRFVVLP